MGVYSWGMRHASGRKKTQTLFNAKQNHTRPTLISKMAQQLNEYEIYVTGFANSW